MIYVDYRRGSGSDGKGKELLQPIIRKLGIPCESCELPYGDACFEGRGLKGPVSVGIERKTLNDMLNCIDDARYSGHQYIGMGKLYSPGHAFMCLEGMWAPGNGNGWDGTLMQGYRGGQSWGPLKTSLGGTRKTLYSKLYRYMISVARAGVIITQSNDLFHTAYNICELYQYFQKKNHTSMMEIHKPAIPVMNGKPTLTRKWADAIESIGVVYGTQATQMFKTPHALANSDESDWMRIEGIGPATAKKIVREIRGWK